MCAVIRSLWTDEQGQDIAEYAVMSAVILVIVDGTIRLIGSNANNVFSSVASSIRVGCDACKICLYGTLGNRHAHSGSR